ncbi:Ankyrin repeat-containing protein [Drosera capensis]
MNQATSSHKGDRKPGRELPHPKENYRSVTRLARHCVHGLWNFGDNSFVLSFATFGNIFPSNGYKGNVEDFQKLVKENPLVLHDVALHPVNNPLYITCAAGHLDLVNEILRMKPEFASELNPDGCSPLHIASANGYVEIVKALVPVDVGLCRLKGREGRTPFHFGAMNGKTDVVSLMLSSCGDCITDVTIKMETALHLAVKNGQYESFHIIVDWIRVMKREDVLNVKDELGNTNCISLGGRINGSEAGDREILQILQHSGCLRAQDVSSSRTPNFPSSSRSSSLFDYFKFQRGRDSPNDFRNTLLVIAVLVATASFQIAVNPPGGVLVATKYDHREHDIPNTRINVTPCCLNDSSRADLAGSEGAVSLKSANVGCPCLALDSTKYSLMYPVPPMIRI